MALTFIRTFDWDDESWRDRAVCRYVDADLFFPVGSTGGAIAQVQAAKGVCRSCPVKDPCLQFALDTNQEAGVWGGKDEVERRSLRAVRRAGRGPQVRPVMS
ncbi:MAG: WhiB family transcriptional regulator [Acidimicrobiales bacterium]|jgi:WhiB family redox-sensing transcriptional regulator